jgi:hypothetical protein
MNKICKQKTWIPVIILIVSGMLLIGGVSASEFGPWSLQTVDSSKKVGQYSSAALDAAGNPAISYYDQTYGDLKYASWDGSTWIITTVDCSRSEGKNKWFFWDRGHDRTQDNDYNKCFHGTEKVGKYSSLAFDSSGKPRISFYDESKGDLKYASWDGSTWVISTVYSTGKVGEYSSLVFDNSDKPRISFYDETNKDLKYAVWNGNRWIITTVDGTNYKKGQKGGNWDGDHGRAQSKSIKVGEYSSLALDSSGNPRISYYDETNKDLKYAAWDGTRWIITTVDGTNYKKGVNGCNWDGDRGRNQDKSIKVGKYSSLALDSSGNPRIGYYDESNKDLKYAAWDGTRWVITTVDSTKRVGEYASLKLDAHDNPRISYYDATHSDLKFAGWNSTTSKWVTETVDSTGKVGSFTSLVLDSRGNPGISYYDQSNKDLKYTYGTGHVQQPAAPVITGLTPSSGPLSGGTVVTITGTGFTGATTVWFGTTAVTSLTVNSDTQITVTSPPSTAGTVNVTVTTLNGTSAVTPAGQFTYTAIPAPVVTGLTPASGPVIGGTVVTITGTGFTGATSVLFGATAGTGLTVNSATQITVTSPAGAAGIVDVTVTTPNGTSAVTPADQFTYTTIPAPTVTGLTPVSGPVIGGTVVTITGTGFTGATSVLFGATAGTGLTVNSATQITVTSPAGAAGIVDVTVTTPNGNSAVTPADKFTYIAAPTVTGITPASSICGTNVSVTNLAGTNFVVGTTPSVWLEKAGQVKIIATDVKVISPTQITCNLTIPTWTSTLEGAWDVVVQNADGQSGIKTGAFTLIKPAPSIGTITPNHSPNGTTINLVIVTGTNFGFGTNPSVWLAKSGQDSIYASDIHIFGTTSMTFVLTLPLTASEGVWDVMVRSEDGQTSANLGAFTIDKQIGATPMIWKWDNVNGWDGWQAQTICEGGSCTIIDPSIGNGYGIYGADVTSAFSTESKVWKTFTPPSGASWNTITFNGMLSSSAAPIFRSMTINVGGLDVYDNNAASDPAINGQSFTITRTFTQTTSPITVTISGKQNPIADASYRMQFYSLTLS